MFQFSGLAARTYGLGSRLFGNLRIKACLTAPRSFSQFSAPFKAFRRQDVPHALFLRLIAPIHHSSRNNRSTCSLFCRYTIGTFFDLLRSLKNKQTDRAVSDPLDSHSSFFFQRFRPPRPASRRDARSARFNPREPFDVRLVVRQNSEECNVFRVFLLSLYKVIELNEFDKIIVMFLRSAACPTYALAPLDPLTLTANNPNSARTVDQRQNPRRHSCIA